MYKIYILLCMFIVSCGTTDNKKAVFEPFTIDCDNPDGYVFKSFTYFNQQLTAIFHDSRTQHLKCYTRVDSQFILNDSVNIERSLHKGFKLINLKKDEQFIYSGSNDSIQLSYIHSQQINHFNLNNYPSLKSNHLIAEQSSKLCQSFISDPNIFEFKLASLADMSSENSFPMTGRLNIKNNTVSLSGIKLPSLYRKNNYGFLSDIQQVYTDNLIIYNPVAQPEIWIYNKHTNQAKAIVVKSEFDNIPTPTISKSDLNQPHVRTILETHQRRSGYYTALTYNPYEDCYYRFYSLPLTEKNAEGYFNTYKDKRISVIKMDSDFKVINEALLPEECFFIYTTIPTKSGLIINRGSLFEDNKVNLMRIEI